jgi:hypothetical protein
MPVSAGFFRTCSSDTSRFERKRHECRMSDRAPPKKGTEVPFGIQDVRSLCLQRAYIACWECSQGIAKRAQPVTRDRLYARQYAPITS